MKMTNPNPSPIGLGFGFVLFGADVHNQPKIHIENPAESSHISPYSCLHCASLI